MTDNESLCLEGYDVPIFQFYTKAMTVQQMRMVLESLMDHAPDMGNRFFIFSSDQSMYQVRLSDITFFEANRSSLFIHTTQKSYACRDTLKNLQTRLRRFPFERIHKSFIVNTKFISCLQSDSLILQDGTVLPVSKHKMAPMRHYLSAHAALPEASHGVVPALGLSLDVADLGNRDWCLVFKVKRLP